MARVVVKSLKRIAVASIASVMVAGVVYGPDAHAGARISPTIPKFGLYLNESFDINLEPSNFYADADNGDSNKILKCSSVDDEKCTQSKNVMIIQNLPTCAIDDTFDCIKSVWAIDTSGKKILGEFQKSMPVKSGSDRPAIASMKLPASNGFGGLWKIPGVTNAGGEDNYFASVRINSWAQKAAGASLRDSVLYYGQLMAGIVPVKAVSGSYGPAGSHPTWGLAGATSENSSGPYYTPEGVRCTVTDFGVCEIPQNFPDGYRFGMSVKLAQKVSGWFHGRMALPQIDITASGQGQIIDIEAEPVKISTLDFLIPTEQMPESVKKLIFADVDWGVMGDPRIGVQTMLNGLSDPVTMKIMTEMLPTIGDKATKTTQYWSYRALNTWQNPEIQKCSKNSNELGGVVTTNALTYSAGPPSFNKKTGSLEYKVASPHFEENGSIALGTYDLAIKGDVARCIYGFSKAPIQASISIINDSGEQKVATTVVNERNGWLYLSAKGFTFSSPTINVKLTQAGAAVPAKKMTLVCMKGKVVKKVSGTSPKCPAGYSSASKSASG